MTVMSMSDYEMTLEFPVVITKFLRSMKGGYLIKSFVAQFHDRAGRKPTALAVGGMPLSIYTYRTKYSIHYATNGKGEVTDVAGATR